MQTSQWDLEQPSRAAQRIAEQAGVPFLDLLLIFRQAASSSQPPHLRVDGHWTPAGERLAGEATAGFLRPAGLADTEREAGWIERRPAIYPHS